MTLKCQWWSVLGYHRWQLHSQEPKFRSEIATSSPLFPMETTPPTTPGTCRPHCKAPSGSLVTAVHHTLWLSLIVLLLQWPSPPLCQEPLDFQRLQTTANLLMTFFLMYNEVTIMTGLPWKSCHFYCQFFGRRCFYKSFKNGLHIE